MFYRDEKGQLWTKEGTGFRNIGVEVREKLVTFSRIESMNVVHGTVTVPALQNPIPVTLREAIKQLGISESNPLKPMGEGDSHPLSEQIITQRKEE